MLQQRASSGPPALPKSGWLLKASGGKSVKASLGNVANRFQKRWFTIDGPNSPLCYFKDAPTAKGKQKAPAGSVELEGASIERTGGGNGEFALHTASRVLTLRADDDAAAQGWARAMVAAGAYAEFDVGTAFEPARSLNDVRPSLKSSLSGGSSSAGLLGGAAAGGGADTAAADASGRAKRKSVTIAKGGESEGLAAMPGMEGYLSKQTGRSGKWDRRYFVIPPGRTSLRYYKTRDDYIGRKEPSGAIDAAGSTLKHERAPGHFVLHIESADGQRTLLLKADQPSTLDHWVTALSSPGRAAAAGSVEPGTIDRHLASAAPGRVRGESTSIHPLAAEEASGGGRAGTPWDGKDVKVLLLGDANVGKTSVLTRFSDGLFVSSTRATIGIDLKKSSIDLDGSGRRLPLQIWDTAGQEQFRSIIASYYRGAHGVLLMFDLTRRTTFDALEGWDKEVKSKAPEHAPVVLIGNKCDCGDQRVVSYEEAVAWARQHGMLYVETSAKNNIKINEAFITLVASSVGRVRELPELLERATVHQAASPHASASAPRNADVGVIQLNGGRSHHNTKPPKGGGCLCN